MVEAPGTAPGSEWFITTAIYRHSRQAGSPNIGANGPKRKSGSRGCANTRWPLRKPRLGLRCCKLLPALVGGVPGLAEERHRNTVDHCDCRQARRAACSPSARSRARRGDRDIRGDRSAASQSSSGGAQSLTDRQFSELFAILRRRRRDRTSCSSRCWDILSRAHQGRS